MKRSDRSRGCWVAGLVLFLASAGVGQTVDLAGPAQMGRCEEALFTVAFTAGVQTASAVVLTATLPNSGFVYVPGSGLITLDDGTPVSAEPSPSGLDLVWNVDLLLGTPYELPPGETVTLEFGLLTGCGTISGTLGARVDWEEEGIPRLLTDSQPIEILPGAILIAKEPMVVEAAVGDMVTWTLRVENTGLGPIYNVVVTDVLGSGLAYVSSNPVGNPVGQTVTWWFPMIPAGGEAEIELQARVIACTGLENRLDARFGCDDGSVCYDTAIQGGTAAASIRLILKQPLLDWTPPSVQIPYCDLQGVQVLFPITNIGEGPAYNVRLCIDCRPLVITDVGPGAYYQSGCFYIDNPILPGETFPLTFTVSVPEGWDWCAGVPSGTVVCQTTYENVCGEEFRPPVRIGGFSTTYGPEGPPTLNASLVGANAVFICTVEEYNLEVSFSGLNTCGGGGTSDISVVVYVPSGFIVEDAGGGLWIPGGDGTGGTISWAIPPTSPLSSTVRLRAPGAPRCGQVATLTATATAQDCCRCPISATSTVPIAIQCYQLVTAVHQASPAVQEKCGTITYTHTYTFAPPEEGLPDINFTELTFTAYAENLQEYVDGTLTLTVNGSPVDPISVVDNTPGGSLIVEGIDHLGLVWGQTLMISYTLRLTAGSAPLSCPSSSTFYAWSTLDLGPDCTQGDECTQPCQVTEALIVTSTTPRMSVSLSGLPQDFVDPCGTYTITLTLTKASTYDPLDVVLRLENLNYYIVDLDSIQVSGVQPTSPIPTDYGTYYEWTYGEAFVGQLQGAQSVLTFQVRKRCGPGVELRAEARYTDACGGPCSASDSDAPVYLRSPNLFVYKTPETVYATQNEITWTIYVVNSGNGYAYEVWVDDFLGSGLEYVSSSITPATGVTTYPNQDHLGNPINGVSWHIAAMSPGEQRVITLTARMIACTDLQNEVVTSLGCGGEDCLLPVADTSTVLVPSTQLVATSSTSSPIASCIEQPALIRIRNSGDPAVYQLVVRETLPPGLEYVPGTTQWRKGFGSWNPGADPTITGDIGSGYTLEWTVTEIPGLAELRSRETLEIEFTFRALCNFEGGSFAVNVEYTNVCGEPGSLPVGTFRVDARRPSLSIQKTQIFPPGGGPVDCGGEITWRIDVTNTGQITIPYVWVEDELGNGFTYVSSTGGVYGIDDGCSIGSTVTWALRNLPAGATAELTLTARETGCGDLTNIVRAWWGCGQDGDGTSCTLDADCLADTYVFREVVATRTPNVSVSAALNPTQIPACGTTTMTLEIRNPSSATASALDVRVGLPAGLTYVQGTTEVDCGAGFAPALDPYILPDGYLYWYDPDNGWENLCDSIPPGGAIRLRFGVQAACYRTTGSAAVRVYFYDCCFLNQRMFDASFPLSPAVPNLTISKTPTTVPLDCFDPGSTVTWQIRVQNTGAASADWVRVEDTLGTNLVYVSSNPMATSMGTQKWGWEFGPLGVGESRTVEITVRLSQPANNCGSALRTNTASAWWGCGTFDGDPNTVEGCTGGGPVTATARATIPDVYLTSTDIVPLLTCVGDGNYTGRVQITIRNAGDAPVNEDFRLTLIETASGWSVSGYFSADFGGTLPIPAGGSRTITIPNWPVTCGQCAYTFTVTLDTENVLCECRENNNSATRAWTITLPDLTVRRDALELTCAGDGQVRISGSVTLGNEGCGDALMANIPMRFVLYDGSGCSGTVLHQWTETFTGVNIPAGGEQTFTVTHTFPLDLCTQATGCTVSLRIEADYTDSICECDGENNTKCSEHSWTIPDLTVPAHDLTMTCAGDGQILFAGTVTLGNDGCGPVGGTEKAPIEVQFTLYDRAGCTGNVLGQGRERLAGMAIPAQGEYTFAIDPALFTANACEIAQECALSVLIEVDYADLFCECSGLNNGLCVDFPIEIPDLAVIEVLPAVADSCSPGRVEVTVANVGCVESPAGAVVRITGAANGETALPAIPAGGTTTVTVELSEILPCGLHEIVVTADPDEQICECSSANNALGAGFTVVDPDLTLTDLVVTCRGDGSFTVTATVRNVGTEASPATAVRIYVDGALAQTLNVPALPIGGSAPLTWTSPRLKCGVDHLFRLVVDEDDAICECNSGNNELETLASCGCPALVTDKAITQILRAGVPVPPNSPVEPGDLVTYTLGATNVGPGWAFGVDLWDELPEEFSYVPGSTSATWPGGSSTADPTGAPGPSLSWNLSATLLPGETLTLQFRAFVTSLARQGFGYTNTMGATGEEGEGTPIPPDSGLPGDEDPDDSDEVVHPAAVPALALDKAIADVLRGGVSRGPTGPVEPGDVIVYTVRIRNVGLGIAYNVDFTDALPAHTEYDTTYGDGTYSVDSPPAAGTLGIPDGATGTITADVSATINPGGTLVATYYVRALSAVSQGEDLVNYAVTTGEDGAGTPIREFNPDTGDTYPDRDSTRIPVVEPGLALDKEIVDVLRGGVSIWPTPIVLWGDVIVYQVTVRNVGLGTAYDVDLTDTLPFGLAYDAGGDGTWTVDAPPASGTLGIPDGATGTISADISAAVAGGGTLVARYRARVLPEAPAGQYLVNVARATGRDGAGTPIPEFNPDVEDSYPDEDETRILLGVPALVTEKGIYCDPCGEEPCAPCPKPPFVYSVGDKVRFQLLVRNVGHSRAYNVRVEDLLPPGFTYVPESTRAVWPGGRSASDPLGAPGPELFWFLGASLDPGEALVVVFEARVTDRAPAGETLRNRMWAFGFDTQDLPIPADQSPLVPEDDDPDDSSTLELQVVRPTGGSRWGGWAAWLGLGGLGLVGLLRLSTRLRLKGLMVGLLALGLLAVPAQAQLGTARIQVLVTPAEGGAVEGEGTYLHGATVRLTALPAWGYQFAGWYEDRERLSVALTLEFAAERDRVLEARFEQIPQSFTLGGSWQGSLALLPSPEVERMTLDLRYVLRYGAVPWTFRAAASFTGSAWTSFQLHGSGRMGEIQVGGGFTFDPSVPAYRTAYLALLHRIPGLTASLRVTHYAQAGTPPGPYLLSNLTLRSGNLSLTARFEEKEGGVTFRDLLVSVTSLELCCRLTAQGSLSFTKAGFSFVQLRVDDLVDLCCGLSLGVSVKFTPGAKEVSLLPRWESPCQGCFTVYGNVLWNYDTRTWDGIAVHGFKIYCCWGGSCPGGGVSSPFVEFVTALDPTRVPGGFQGEEFEYLKFGFCGPACCGGSYSFEGTVYFVPSGSLFGISRVLLSGGVPLFPGMTVEIKVVADVLGGTTGLSVGWNFRF